MRKIDITDERYGMLVALAPAPNRGRRTQWVFRCDCGVTKEIGLEGIRSGLVRSCGCLRTETTRKRSTVHGHKVGYKSSRTYKAWLHARERCQNPNIERFADYGGRGISMCRQWSASFEAFLKDMGECPPGMTIERIDNNGHYEPGNCRWATDYDQRRNRRDNVFVEVGETRMILKDYASLRGVDYKRLHAKMRRRGMTAQQAADAILGG